MYFSNTVEKTFMTDWEWETYEDFLTFVIGYSS